MDDTNSCPPRSVEAIYRQHFGFVWATLRSLGVPEAAIEDAVQDVFVVVHRRLDTFEERCGLRTWLFGIARRIASRVHRGRARTERRRHALASVPRPVVDGEATIERRLLGDQLLRALDGLDEDKRTALVLHVMHDLRGPEIAEVLGIPVDTAYSRIKAARQGLRRALGPLAADDPAMRSALHRAVRAPSSSRQRVLGLLLVRIGRRASPIAAGWSLATVAAAAIVALAVAAVSEPVAGSEPGADRPLRTRGTIVEPEPNLASHPRAHVEVMGDRPMLVSARPRPTPVRPAPPPSRRAAGDALGEEVALLDRVRAALDANDVETALEALDAHAARYPRGQLAAEREGYRALAECQAGELAAGELRGRRFVEAHPNSGLATRVRDRCRLDPSGDSA